MACQKRVKAPAKNAHAEKSKPRLRDRSGRYVPVPSATSEFTSRTVGATRRLSRMPTAVSKSISRRSSPARGQIVSRNTTVSPSPSVSSAATDSEASADGSRTTREPSDTPSDSSSSSNDSVKSELSMKSELSSSPSLTEDLVKMEPLMKMEPLVKMELDRTAIQPEDVKCVVKRLEYPSSTLQAISAQRRREPTIYVFHESHEYPVPVKLRFSMNIEQFFASVLGAFGLPRHTAFSKGLKVTFNELPEGYLTESWLVKCTAPDSFEVLLEVISEIPACKEGRPYAIRVDILT